MIVAEVPAGVLADAVSRRLALVTSHLVRGTGMVMTGFVTDFRLLVLAQCLWGLGWALSSGADVAWITDELDDPERIDRVLVAEARRELAGTVAGTVVAGTVAWATHREVAIVGAGVVMVAMAATVARWPETGFAPIATGRWWTQAMAIFRLGAALARADRVILLVLVATALANGGHEGFGRLHERRQLLLGLPTTIDPVVWFTVLGLASALAGAVTLRTVEARIDGTGVAVRVYVGAAGVGVVGLVGFAFAPERGVGRGRFPPRGGHRLPHHPDRRHGAGQPADDERGAGHRPLDGVPGRERRRARPRVRPRRRRRRHIGGDRPGGVGPAPGSRRARRQSGE